MALWWTRLVVNEYGKTWRLQFYNINGWLLAIGILTP